ncbi:MAG: Unknown protein [uncultured Aureispira sp.]|uniref:Uncharacterized protein n=1 Tax=uncultured Aureispira sp. TaxID=1331704 RepID=A0A6S6UM33_9BACT|nr:MAG: Unknown protein [uncultured Aureispira sp.]
MQNYIIVFLFWMICFCHKVEAHQPELSSTMLIEQANGQWLLQVRSALTAFQYEIKTNYPDRIYESPEAFQDLVLEHLEKNINIYFNGDQDNSVVIQKGYVKLGHETNVVFEIAGVPNDIKSVSAKNSTFSGISRNQSALIVAKSGFEKAQFVLNNKNQHRVELVLKNKQFELVKKSTTENLLFSKYTYLIGISLSLMLALMLLMYWGINRRK